jgi:hypothetical protein
MRVSFPGCAERGPGRRSGWVIARPIAIALTLIASGCAFDVVHLRQVPARFEASPPSEQVWTLQNDVRVRLVSGWATGLKKGTRWRLVGHTEQGDVLKTQDQVVTVRASNMFEANPVIKDGQLVGFFLVIENYFTPADPPKSVELVAGQGT